MIDLPYRVGMISLGCPKNQVDAEIMLSKLSEAGFEITNDEQQADLIIVNTCGFIEDAKKEAIETILETAQLKENGSLKALVVTGCLAERYREMIKEEMPEVDAVIGIGANDDIVKVCKKALVGIETSFFPSKMLLPLDGKRMLTTPKHWAYLKISDGCSNRCSYCAIPGIRGDFRSRSMESIVSEANELVANGAKELILIAQDTTKYGYDIYGKLALCDLLRELVKIDDLKWIRLFYCYPDRITDELIDLMAKEEKICNYIDIPLQHANKDILKKMNRTGDAQSLTTLISKLREKMPDISIRTTFMVGFPYEGEEEFEDLVKFIQTNKFDKLGCFTFSPEEDTPAADFDCQIDEAVKQRRAEVVMNEQYTISEEKNRGLLGRTFEVVVDGYDENNKMYICRSYMDSPEIDAGIFVKSDKQYQIGSYINVVITDVNAYDLIGEVVS